MRPLQESDVFHAIAHPARRAILVELKGGERAASELAAPFDMTFAAISQHLKVLEEADLVSVRRDGRQRFYKLEPKPLRDVVSWIDEFSGYFGERLDALGAYLDKKHGKKRG
ncbi:MAG: metalloregulator ArsR/SmtB family transcription factor [Polyangiaceae bacterium]